MPLQLFRKKYRLSDQARTPLAEDAEEPLCKIHASLPAKGSVPLCRYYTFTILTVKCLEGCLLPLYWQFPCKEWLEHPNGESIRISKAEKAEHWTSSTSSGRGGR